MLEQNKAKSGKYVTDLMESVEEKESDFRTSDSSSISVALKSMSIRINTESDQTSKKPDERKNSPEVMREETSSKRRRWHKMEHKPQAENLNT
jgi:hypothetical protein